MIGASRVYDFPSLYIEIAKLKPHDINHIMRCLSNRQRVLQKEMGLHRRHSTGAPQVMSTRDDLYESHTL